MCPSIKKIVGKNVRALRKDIGFSQEILAATAGIDRSYMGRIERGEANPSILTLELLSTVLNVEPFILLKR